MCRISPWRTPKFGDKPYQGAHPYLRRQPEIKSAAECRRRTEVVIKLMIEQMKTASAPGASGVIIGLGNIGLNEGSAACFKDLLAHSQVSDAPGSNKEMIQLFLGDHITHSYPRDHVPFEELTATNFKSANGAGSRYTVLIGQPSNYIGMAINSQFPGIYQQCFDDASFSVVTSTNSCMLPIGKSVESVVGIDSMMVCNAIKEYLKDSGKTIGWSHGEGTKTTILNWIMPSLNGMIADKPMPAPLTSSDFANDDNSDDIERSFKDFDQFFAYMNQLKAARPGQTLCNYFDVGLTVTLISAHIARSGISLLLDTDNFATLNEGSIGNTMTKMVQLTKTKPYRTKPAVYNFYVGDGACRLNGGLELIFDLIEKAQAYDDFKPLLNLFVFHNNFWAVEDNLVGKYEEEHKLHNQIFYDLLGAHDQSTTCRTEEELAAKLGQLTDKFDRYTRSLEPQSAGEEYDTNAWLGNHIELIIVESMREIPLPPPILGDLSGIKTSPEMIVFKSALEHFAKGCKEPIPIYGCSAFEYIQYLDTFMSEDSELSRKYEYCCAKTDIQAAQLCGYTQPEGKAILMINDVYGIHSLGEALRAHMQKVESNAQIMVWIWHPMFEGVMDLFTVHRPQLVWPSVGPHYIKYFANNQKDLASIELTGDGTDTIREIVDATNAGTKLISVNMIPSFDRNSIAIDTHISTE